MTLPDDYPDEFKECLPHIFALEGGLANDSADPGGLTKYGISKRAFPWLNIRTLTKYEAGEIYYLYYWQPIRAHLIPPHLRLAVFDCAVNNGAQKAVLLLQILSGAHQDGIMGRITAEKSERVTVEQYLDLRARVYRDIARNRPASRKFLFNWLHRLRYIRGVLLRSLQKKA